MNTPQIMVFIICAVVFVAAFILYFKVGRVAGTTTIIVAFILCIVGAVGPSTIKDMIFKQSESGIEFSFRRNIDTPEKIQSAIKANAEIDKGITSKERGILVQESMSVPDAKRSAADYLILATNSWKSKNIIDGITYVQQGLRLNPKDVRLKATLLLRMGALLFDMGDDVWAEKYYRKSICVDSKFSWPYNNLGILFHDFKKYDEAEDAYNKAIEIDPKNVNAYGSLGNFFRDLKRYDEAEDAYNKAIEINPKYVNAYGGLGDLLRGLKRYDEAEDAYNKVIEIDPKNANAYAGLGNLFRDLKRYDEAEVAYNKAIKIDPKNANTYGRLGDLLRDLKRYDEAEDAYNKVIEIDPKNANAYRRLGDLLRGLKRYDEAAESYRKASE